MKQLSTYANNSLINARRAKECQQYGQARSYYLSVLREDPEHWEAFFYSTFCGVINADISQSAHQISNCLKMVLKDIKKLEDIAEQNKAIEQISTDLLNYVALARIKEIDTYEKSIDINVEARNRAYSVLPFGFTKLGEIDMNLKYVASLNISRLSTMLSFFGGWLVEEFGKNEFIKPIIIKCYETAFEMTPSQYDADKLKQVNPYSPELLKYENRGILKKFWEKLGPDDRFHIGCAGVIIALYLLMAIIVLIEYCSSNTCYYPWEWK